MPDGLYERDALLWSEQQAELLRRLQRGERVNAEIDWPNLIGEIADAGLSELHGCESLLGEAMTHLLKLRFGPRAPARHWTAEVIGFLGQAHGRFSPSMRHRIRLEDKYRSAGRQAEILFPDRAQNLPPTCPWTLDELLAREPDIQALLDKL